jgi:hypothetical protein
MNNLSPLEKRLLQILIVLIPVVGLALFISIRLDSFSAQQRTLFNTPELTPGSPSGSGAGALNQPATDAPVPTEVRPTVTAVSPTMAMTPGPSAVPSQDLAADMQNVFVAGQTPAWKLLHGQPNFSNGFVAPSSAAGLTLQIGSQGLQNYSASFDIRHPSDRWELVLTAGKDVMGAITPGGTTWYSNQGGGWKAVSTGPGIPGSAETVSFSVDGSTVSVRVNGLPLTAMNSSVPVSGPLVISLSERISLGNLAIYGH